MTIEQQAAKVRKIKDVRDVRMIIDFAFYGGC
jgi:hypothetical protein